MLRWRYLALEKAPGEAEGRKEAYASGRKRRDSTEGVYECIEVR